MKLRVLLSALGLALTLAASCRAEVAARPSAAVGQAAPGFSLKDAAGREHTLEEFKGKLVVLEWVNFGCPFVKKHYGSGNMQGLQAEYTGKGVVWLSICSSAPGKQGHFEGEELQKQIAEHRSKASYYLLDPEGSAGRQYGAKTTPHMYVVDPAGNLVYAGGIDDLATADPDDIPKARNYVRQALDALLAGQPVPAPSTAPYGCSVKYAGK